MCAAGLALAVMIAVSIGIPSAGASRKLYDMSIFLQPARGAPGRRAAPAPIPEPAPWHSAAGAKPQPPPVWTGAPLPLRTADASSGARGTSGFAFANIFSEFFLGFWRHDPEQDNNESDTLDLNAEIVFRKIRWFDVDNPIADFILSPRPLIGGSVHNQNETHTAYTELNWRYIFTNDVFIAGSFGLTYHTGNLERPTLQCTLPEVCHLPGNRAFDDDRRAVTLGSRILFRESLAMGYRLTRHHSVSFYGAHISNGGILAKDNDGMNFVGIRYGYSLE